MGLIDDFLEYLKVVKKHSSLTIDNYKIDLYNFYEYTKGNFNINKARKNCKSTVLSLMS